MVTQSGKITSVYADPALPKLDSNAFVMELKWAHFVLSARISLTLNGFKPATCANVQAGMFKSEDIAFLLVLIQEMMIQIAVAFLPTSTKTKKCVYHALMAV